jgi:hypothetical protein
MVTTTVKRHRARTFGDMFTVRPYVHEDSDTVQWEVVDTANHDTVMVHTVPETWTGHALVWATGGRPIGLDDTAHYAAAIACLVQVAK